ncbi:HEAT repeat domain-containing protein [Maridesulfovibrio hydrothermalis]|uniref:Response regulator receiver protein n=1 Tax=Maridesulfovibrio hydrothermalis AM13 = DSM 14728 TaxID=1121451 RepID=L0RAM6_9BACT|nr:HEAT repeat domain-containing protein [Maridesulfovibrio hydrothermalis]CCO22621.1 Response regulator receiver protein [Maridesulfovibrio hydrothermalis AM13 = DSM 14728]
MSMLAGFREKPFLDKISILNEVATGKDAAELEGLLDLFQTPLDDTSVDYMVVTALNGVLSSDEQSAVKQLESADEKLKVLCIRLCGEFKFKSSVPELLKIAEGTDDADLLFEVLTSLSKIGGTEAIELFRSNIDNDDDLVVVMSIEMLGELKDEQAIDGLKAIVLRNNEDDRYEVCDLTTWKAVEALAEIGTDAALDFIVENIHHRNPTVRRVATDSLCSLGGAAVPYLKKVISPDSDKDDMILAANVLGFIGDKDGLDVLMDAVEKQYSTDSSVKYAIYEAIGRIGTMKGVISLIDGLNDEDELIIVAVLTGLDSLVNPGVIKKMVEIISEGGSKAGKILRGIVTARAVNIFAGLYSEGKIGRFLMNAVVASKDMVVHEAFRLKLVEIGGDEAQADIARLPEHVSGEGKRALAVDDSKSMLALYRSILTSAGYEPVVAENGQEAYELVENGDEFDVIITDMNMPVMDGMEFVSKLRQTAGFEDLPVIMVTTESEGSQKELAQKTGVTDFITKPFTADQLKSKIEEYVS